MNTHTPRPRYEVPQTMLDHAGVEAKGVVQSFRELSPIKKGVMALAAGTMVVAAVAGLKTGSGEDAPKPENQVSIMVDGPTNPTNLARVDADEGDFDKLKQQIIDQEEDGILQIGQEVKVDAGLLRPEVLAGINQPQ